MQFQIIGYFITDTREIGVQLNVLGFTLGNFYGNADDGLTIQIELVFITGTANFYIANGALASQKELRLKYSLSSAILSSTSSDGDVLIFTF